MERYEQLIFNRIDQRWLSLIKTPELTHILRSICTSQNLPQLCPPIGEIFNAFRYTPYDRFHTVIIGQDPYYSYYMDETGTDRPIAHGLAFSTLDNKAPPSLINIYKALKYAKLIDQTPTTYNLVMWAQQGVLMINTAFTTLKGVDKAHVKLWEPYVGALLQRILSSQTHQINIMQWGGFAQKLVSKLTHNHKIMAYSHPSPLSDNRLAPEQKFERCPHFAQIGIDWNPEVQQLIFTDGSYKRKSQVGGYAVIFFYGAFDGHAIWGTTPQPCTNNRSEGLALVKALQFANKHNLVCPIFVTDSEFYINVITSWMYSWHAIDSNFSVTGSKAPIKNIDIIRQLWVEWEALKQFTNPQIIHQRSHQTKPQDDDPAYINWYGNHIADLYASKMPATEQFRYIYG